MNYLAHAYLSFRQPGILVGNLVSDFVKGRKKYDYPPEILRGIELHRAIDQFTDDHPYTIRAKEVFRPAYRLYAAAFVDVSYDHFLARDEEIFPGEELKNFSNWVYETMDRYTGFFPDRFASMYPYMKSQNWLYNYRSREGIERSFGGLVRRAAYMHESMSAIHLFHQHYTTLEECYRSFIGDLVRFTQSQPGMDQG